MNLAASALPAARWQRLNGRFLDNREDLMVGGNRLHGLAPGAQRLLGQDLKLGHSANIYVRRLVTCMIPRLETRRDRVNKLHVRLDPFVRIGRRACRHKSPLTPSARSRGGRSSLARSILDALVIGDQSRVTWGHTYPDKRAQVRSATRLPVWDSAAGTRPLATTGSALSTSATAAQLARLVS